MTSVLQPSKPADRSLADQAYFRIRELIVTLELRPGSAINERDLIERIDLGRTPIRDALRMLQQDRLVEVFPRRGILVAGVNAGDLAGLSEVRSVLEPQGARLAAERRTPADLVTIDALLSELDTTVGDQRELIALDQRIHSCTYHCTHNPFLEATLASSYIHALRIWFLALDRVARLETSILEHRELLEAIAGGNGDLAEAAMARHVAGFERAIRAVL